MSASAATTAAGKGIPGCVLSVSDPSDFCIEWNAENQLKRVLKNGVEQARFSYDPRGRRVEKVAAGVTTTYLYERSDILREVRGGVTLKYVHGPGIDEPLAREDGAGALTYYHADALGSVVMRTSQAGAVVHEYRYDAWGNIEVGTTEPGYAFTGREWDPEAGLHYYRARYYDPAQGIFLSEDPAGLAVGSGPYAYAHNDPVDRVDPLGLYDTHARDDVAIQAMRSIWSDCQTLSWGSKYEYVGNICECGGKLLVGRPVKQKSGLDVPPCSSGTLIGAYHCHPPGDRAESFSTEDQDLVILKVVDAVYLLTPSGLMRWKTRWAEGDFGRLERTQ